MRRQQQQDFVYLKGLMTLSSDNHFLQTIRHLREQEEMLVYDRLITATRSEEEAVGDFLRKEYEMESVGFPGNPPAFAQAAAVWAARIVYDASQLLLFRDQNEKDLERLLADYPAPIDAAAVLSADLCLRCLPDVIAKTREINPDDVLVSVLEDLLKKWHYSGVGYFRGGIAGDGPAAVSGGAAVDEVFDWGPVLANDCLRRLYTDRVIRGRVTAFANSRALRSDVRAALGDHADYFWKELREYDESDRETE
ncbi:hypothetical protein ACQ86N_11565 [Puia sp. P3]|uniref:hypothetical protein n=1 Tax=Puia sp. P3 TaxID=3423952 RepID=UPI003D67974F